MSLRYVRDHKIMSAVAAVVVVVVIALVATRSFGSSADGGVSSATCNAALADLKNAPTDIENNNGQDLYTASNSAYNAAYNAAGYGSKFVKDLSTLETDANVLSSGASDNTSTVTSDLQTVYADCGESYPGS